MLHQGILPHHAKWVKLFENLRYVVIDEIHAYRGVFGSNLANVIRRLKRICAFYGSRRRRSSAAAATIAESQRAGRGDDRAPRCVLIDENGAPAGERHVVFYNPPVVNAQLGIRAGSIPETRNIAAGLAQVGHSEHRVRPRAADGRGAGAVSEGHGARSARQRRPRARLPRRLSAQRSGARSSASCAPGTSPRSSRRTRWSWASTSASSTPACCAAIRARSRAHGSRPGAPGGAAARRC